MRAAGRDGANVEFIEMDQNNDNASGSQGLDDDHEEMEDDDEDLEDESYGEEEEDQQREAAAV